MQTRYACRSAATTSEHIPPKMHLSRAVRMPLGGADLRRNLITVPSCEEHNLRKSGDARVLLVCHEREPPCECYCANSVVD